MANGSLLIQNGQDNFLKVVRTFLSKSQDKDGTEKVTILIKRLEGLWVGDKPMARALKSRKFRRAWSTLGLSRCPDRWTDGCPDPGSDFQVRGALSDFRICLQVPLDMLIGKLRALHSLKPQVENTNISTKELK